MAPNRSLQFDPVFTCNWT